MLWCCKQFVPLRGKNESSAGIWPKSIPLRLLLNSIITPLNNPANQPGLSNAVSGHPTLVQMQIYFLFLVSFQTSPRSQFSPNTKIIISKTLNLTSGKPRLLLALSLSAAKCWNFNRRVNLPRQPTNPFLETGCSAKTRLDTSPVRGAEVNP